MEDWVPEGYVQVGNYAFESPNVPTVDQVEEAEQFVFNQPRFEGLEEDQRRRNVIRLAVHHAFTDNQDTDVVHAKDRLAGIAYVPLIGGFAKITSKLHEGTIVREYELE